MARQHIDPQAALEQRVARARAIVAERAYLAGDGWVLVYTDDPGVVGGAYEVLGDRCVCPDATVGYAARHLGGVCKHAAAAQIAQSERQRAERRRLAEQRMAEIERLYAA